MNLTRPRWNACSLLAETCRNLLADRSLCVPVILVIAVAMGALSYADFQSGYSALEQDQRLAAAGRDVLIIRPADPSVETGISRERCDVLNRSPAVAAAGGLVPLGPREFDDRPGTSFRLYLSTGQAAQALDPNAPASVEGWISVALGKQVGLGSGHEALVGGQTVRVSHFDPAGRVLLGDLMLLVPTAQQSVEECWVEAVPGSTEAVQNAALATLYHDLPLTATPVLSANPAILTPAEQYRERPTRNAPIIAGLILATPLVALAWFGRSSLMLYRTVGARRSGAIVLGLVPQAWMLFTGSALGISTSLVLAVHIHDDQTLAGRAWEPAIAASAQALALAWVVTAAATIAISFGDPVSQLKS